MSRTNRSIAFFGAAALAAVVSGCGKQSGGTASDPAAVTSAIQADEKKWNEDFKAKNLEGLLGHYSDDAFFVAGGSPANGSTEIRKTYSDGLSDNYFSVSFASDKIDVSGSGDMAYARGHFTQKYQDRKSGQIANETGSYLTVYKKQADGTWKAVEDFAVADPATRKMTPVVVKGPKLISM
jgi:uncharacterized protein (TIGR02246 family)